jgi:hypothetical protein
MVSASGTRERSRRLSSATAMHVAERARMSTSRRDRASAPQDRKIPCPRSSGGLRHELAVPLRNILIQENGHGFDPRKRGRILARGR